MKILYLLIIILMILTPVKASEFTAPTVPEFGEKYFPQDSQTFSEGLWHILKEAISELNPDIMQAASVCLGILIVAILVAVLSGLQNGNPKTVELTGTVLIATMLIKPSNQLIQFAITNITELCEYGKLLIPVMTAALAAQGGTTSAAALCAGSMFLINLLAQCVGKLILPVVTVYMVLCIARNAVSEQMLDGLHKFIKWLMTWGLKIILYVFTGYLSITGVVSGSVDASAMKATKLSISGMVPVVGSIMADASEALLAGAGLMKNAAGVYGMLAIIAVWISPFLRIAVHYLILKITAGICSIFSEGKATKVIRDFSSVMGFLLAMTAAVCVMLMISTVCFMKGVA